MSARLVPGLLALACGLLAGCGAPDPDKLAGSFYLEDRALADSGWLKRGPLPRAGEGPPLLADGLPKTVQVRRPRVVNGMWTSDYGHWGAELEVANAGPAATLRLSWLDASGGLIGSSRIELPARTGNVEWLGVRAAGPVGTEPVEKARLQLDGAGGEQAARVEFVSGNSGLRFEEHELLAVHDPARHSWGCELRCVVRNPGQALDVLLTVQWLAESGALLFGTDRAITLDEGDAQPQMILARVAERPWRVRLVVKALRAAR